MFRTVPPEPLRMLTVCPVTDEFTYFMRTLSPAVAPTLERTRLAVSAVPLRETVVRPAFGCIVKSELASTLR